MKPTKIVITPAMRRFNDALEMFDHFTAFKFQRVNLPAALAQAARNRGWADLARILETNGEAI